MEVSSRSGITLVELLVVTVIVVTMIAIAGPSVSNGLAIVRLSSSASSLASFLSSAMNRVERHEQAAAIVIKPKDNVIDVYTAASGNKPLQQFAPPQGISIEGDADRRVTLFPGGAFPRIGVTLKNEKGAERSVQIDPITAVPQITPTQIK